MNTNRKARTTLDSIADAQRLRTVNKIVVRKGAEHLQKQSPRTVRRVT